MLEFLAGSYDEGLQMLLRITRQALQNSSRNFLEPLFVVSSFFSINNGISYTANMRTAGYTHETVIEI